MKLTIHEPPIHTKNNVRQAAQYILHVFLMYLIAD
jgi:hypothetical protein